MSAITGNRDVLRQEIDRRRRELLGIHTPKPIRTDTSAELVAAAIGVDYEAYSRLRLSCCEFSPIDLDLHAAQVLLDVQRIHLRVNDDNDDGPAALTLGAGATGPDGREV